LARTVEAAEAIIHMKGRDELVNAERESAF